MMPPAECAVASRYPGADLVDAFAVTLPGRGRMTCQGWLKRRSPNPAPWITAAMALRDAAVRLFGVRTSGAMRARLKADGRDRIDFFPVLSRSEREIVLGEDDRHLDFRLSLLLSQRPDGREDLVATTVVRCRNRLGHAYLAAIMPGHILVVRSALRRARHSRPAGWPFDGHRSPSAPPGPLLSVRGGGSRSHRELLNRSPPCPAVSRTSARDRHGFRDIRILSGSRGALSCPSLRGCHASRRRQWLARSG
ncbi:hypothetical protein CTI14_04515 [Methylobacterium radiotolerans]|nr:hypothetical protein CTI14_04515 [Methylobacterium radiotolerans]